MRAPGAKAINRFLKKTVCRQTMVYWAPTQRRSDGNMAFDSPIEIPCRWDTDIDVLKSYNGTLTAVLNGREVVLSGSILFPLNYTLVEEGYVYLGTLSSLTPEAQLDPTYAPNVREIIKVTTTPFMGADGSNNEDLFKMVYI